jgi:hypothetical protein
MVDNRHEITQFFQPFFAVLLMRAVNFCTIQTFKFLDVFLDVVSFGIKLHTLRPRVENPEPRASVVSGAYTPLPAPVVGREIPVDQMLHKVPFPQSPVHEQVLGQEGGGYHPASVMHPADGVQLSHRSVNDGHSRPPLTPRLEMFVVIFPFDFVILPFIRFILANMGPSSKDICISEIDVGESYADKSRAMRPHLSSSHSHLFLCLTCWRYCWLELDVYMLGH